MKELVAVLLAFLIILTGCNTVKVTKIDDENKTDGVKFSSEYKNVSKDNNYKYAVYENIKDMLKSGTGIIFLSHPDCKLCKIVAPILNDAVKEKEVKEINYYNFKDIKDNNTEEYQELLNIINDNVHGEEEVKEINAPTIIFVKDGIIKQSFSYNEELSDEKVKELFIGYIDEIYDNKSE